MTFEERIRGARRGDSSAAHRILETIFEPFRRGRTPKEGSGLGLAIARRAVELQGGHLGADSPGESGSHFWITMPRTVCTEEHAAEIEDTG